MGHVATYIPELANMEAGKLGIYVSMDNGNEFSAGDCSDLFTMQSVVKPLILLQALMDSGIYTVRALVGVEATGKPFDAFNYSDQALTGAHINAMINTGAIAHIFARHGMHPKTGEQMFPTEYAKYVNATLATCGMYDGSGEFALKVGFPAKSGVDGGIMGVIPHRMGIGVFAPALDKHGNSYAGVRALEKLSLALDLSIY